MSQSSHYFSSSPSPLDNVEQESVSSSTWGVEGQILDLYFKVHGPGLMAYAPTHCSTSIRPGTDAENLPSSPPAAVPILDEVKSSKRKRETEDLAISMIVGWIKKQKTADSAEEEVLRSQGEFVERVNAALAAVEEVIAQIGVVTEQLRKDQALRGKVDSQQKRVVL